MAITTTMKVLGAAVALAITGPVSAEGNRYDYERYYQREISASEAYLAMEHSKDFKNVPGQAKPVLVDVRTLREYASGHPVDAYNIPFPIITGVTPEVTQDPNKFYWAVHDLVNGNLDTPIMLLCRTGSRSVRGGNILANPDSNPATSGLAPFTNVTNIWDGFVGLYRYAFINGLPDPTKPLDLDNNTNVDTLAPFGIDDDYADVHVQTKDANPDKDGWRNFAGLPWTTQIRKPQAYERDPGLYKALNLTPVQ
jgi:rhodanese-related sulfurtransferase